MKEKTLKIVLITIVSITLSHGNTCNYVNCNTCNHGETCNYGDTNLSDAVKYFSSAAVVYVNFTFVTLVNTL